MKSKIIGFALAIMFLFSAFTVAILAVPLTVEGAGDTLLVSQDRSVSRVQAGETATFNFTVTNPTDTRSGVQFTWIFHQQWDGKVFGVGVTITVNGEIWTAPEENEEGTDPGGTVSVTVEIDTSRSIPAGREFILALTISDDKGFSDTFEVVTTVEAVYDFYLLGVTDPMEGDVQTSSYREYAVGIRNAGNIEDTYALSVSDQKEIVDTRVLNTTGNWTILTHSTQGVHDASDEIDYVSVEYSASRYFYVDVQPDSLVENDTVFRFNLTIESLGTNQSERFEIITTVVDNPYDVSMSLISSEAEIIEIGGFVDYNFTVTGAETVNETISLSVLGNLWAVQNGWEFLLLDSSGAIVGGYYESRGWDIEHEEVDNINNAWKSSPEVTSAGRLGDVHEEDRDWGFDEEPETDKYGVYTLDTPGQTWRYDPGIYEHPYLFDMPANTTMNFTLRILAPDNASQAPRGTVLHTNVVAQVIEESGIRLGLVTENEHEYTGHPAEEGNLWLWIAVISAIAITVILVLAYRNTKKNYYYPKKGKGCKDGYTRKGDRCERK